jgi:hypothetical protein
MYEEQVRMRVNNRLKEGLESQYANRHLNKSRSGGIHLIGILRSSIHSIANLLVAFKNLIEGFQKMLLRVDTFLEGDQI